MPSPRRSPAPRPARPTADGRARRRRHRQRAAPGRAGRYRNRQDARLSRPGDPGRQALVVATATKALQDQLATKDLPFLAEHLGIDVRLGGAEGPQQLPLPAATPRGAAPATGQLELETMAVTRRPRSSGSPSGPATSPPATRPSSTGARPTRRGGRSASAATSAPAPTGARWASRASPSWHAAAPRWPTWSSSTPHLYGLERRQRRRDPARARRRGVRRGARARGHHERHGRRRDRAGPVRQRRPRTVRRIVDDPPLVGRSPTSPRPARRARRPSSASACRRRCPTRSWRSSSDARLRLGAHSESCAASRPRSKRPSSASCAHRR